LESITLSPKLFISGGIEVKKLLMLFLILLTFAALFGCGEDELPSIRAKNETADEVNISFKQSTDPTTNINEVQLGATSAFREIKEGPILVTGLPDKDGLTFTAETGSDYTVVVRSDNSRIEITGQ
jgi:hypothetical protein